MSRRKRKLRDKEPFGIFFLGVQFFGLTGGRIGGSYVTTEWITLLLPIIPLKSVRRYPMEGKMEVLPALHRRQVAHIYKYVAICLFGWAIAAAIILAAALVLHNIPGYVKIVGYVIAGVIVWASYQVFGYAASTDPEYSEKEKKERQGGKKNSRG